MHTLLALLLFVVVFVVPNQVIAEENPKQDFGKRQVSVLARDGNLPFEGKRYIGQKQPEEKTAVRSWRNENGESDPSVFLVTNKRYVGALAKSGDLRFKEQDDKREDVDTLIEELLTAEELRRIRLEALREELLKQQEEDAEGDAEKRSISSLARTGGIPGKRSISSMARAGYLPFPAGSLPEDFDKRGISSLARNGLLPVKKGGISSIMRNGGYSYHKRSFDSEFDNQLLDEEDMDDKRNIGSIARGFTLPSMGKRNIAAFARNGWLPNIGPNAKKSSDYEWDESKRNLQALLKSRMSPFSEGKRYLGAFVANNRLPYSRAGYDDDKRNIGAMARSWNLHHYGKRSWDDNDRDLLARLYVSSLLKEGSLPFSPENVENFESDNFNEQHFRNYEAEDDLVEDKRHIGSFMAHKSFAMRKKKSISPEDQFSEQAPTTSSSLKSRTDENKMDNEIQKTHRPKREAFADFSTDSDEYPMPVMQNTDGSEYEDGNPRSNFEDQSSTRKKRYFAVRGGGKIPGGRLPHVGRSRSNNPNSGRRRH